MPDSAFQTMYRQEFIAGYEQRQSIVRKTVTQEAQIKGNQATFLVADSGGATAVTRGVNGYIPARSDNLQQKTATLYEWHDLVRKTDFNIFASQGDGRAIMQQTTQAVINRKVDQDIIALLATATQDTGTATTASLALANYARVILGNNDVPLDGDVYGLITPAFEAYLLGQKEFASADYVNRKPLDGSALTGRGDFPQFIWAGVTWIVHSNLPGKGTNAEKCFVYHRSAIGHAMNTAGLQTPVGYDEEQAYSWARASVDMGGVVLQSNGIVVINHDGSAFAPQ